MTSKKKWSKNRRVSELLVRKNGKYNEIRQSLLSLNILGELPAFNTRQYSPKHYHILLERASIEQMSIKQTCLMEKFQGRKCPSPEQVMKCCRATTPEKMTNFVNLALKSQFNALPKSIQQQFKKSGILIIDFHQDCYYGDRSNPHVRRSKTKKSTNLFYEYLTADLYSKLGCFTISLLHRPLGTTIISLVTQLLKHVKSVIPLKIVLFDGEFATIDVIKLFKQEGLKFLGRKKRSPRIVKHLQEYIRRSNWKKHRMWHQVEMLSRKKRKKTVIVDICPQDVYGTIKALVKSPGWNITPAYADILYKKRFQIETGYRDKHKFQLFTCTKILSTRLLAFLMAILLWNCWQCYLIWIRALKIYSKDLPRDFQVQISANWFKFYLKNIFQLYEHYTNQKEGF